MWPLAVCFTHSEYFECHFKFLCVYIEVEFRGLSCDRSVLFTEWAYFSEQMQIVYKDICVDSCHIEMQLVTKVQNMETMTL